jgi:hypothetical protein
MNNDPKAPHFFDPLWFLQPVQNQFMYQGCYQQYGMLPQASPQMNHLQGTLRQYDPWSHKTKRPDPVLQPGSAAASVPARKKADAAGLTPDTFTAKGLTQADLDVIVSKYGSEIDDIFDLAPGQSWMFGKAQKVTNAFFIQALLKVTLKLKPSTFRQKVDAMSLKRSNLRTAFAYRGQETPYQVVLKNRRPELRFVDRSDKTLQELSDELETFRAADRRRGFDLECDPLLRITVFSTSEEDTYALVVSQPHINHDGTSEAVFYKELLLDYAADGQLNIPDLASGSYQDYARFLQSIDKEAELQYWEELLAGSSMTPLPGRIHSALEPVMNTIVLQIDKKSVRAAKAV